MNLTATLAVTATENETLTFGGVSQAVQDQNAQTLNYANGTGADQVDLHWAKSAVSVSGGSSVTYTLSALTDDLGRTVALVGVRYVQIVVRSRTAGNYLLVGGAASNAWAAPFGSATDKIKVYKLETLAADGTDKYAVASGSSDQLKIANPGGSAITFDIKIVGVSA